MSIALSEGLPHARLAILPGCAHVPQLQAPDLFMKAVAGFLAEATEPAE
jgi:3-oxoadipate enol-lactonase